MIDRDRMQRLIDKLIDDLITLKGMMAFEEKAEPRSHHDICQMAYAELELLNVIGNLREILKDE